MHESWRNFERPVVPSPVAVREAAPRERGPIWEKQKADYPIFAEYEAGTGRVIPVFILERLA